MKRNILLYILIVSLCACGGGGGGDVESLEIRTDFLSVTPSLELLGDGQTTEFTISANSNWTITKDVQWLTVSPMSGTGSQSVTVSAIKNTTDNERKAILTVRSGTLPPRTVTVTQLKPSITYFLTVNREAIHFGNQGDSQTFYITSNTSWSISSPEWCTLSASSGNGNATITVTALANSVTEQRSAKIVITGNNVQTVNIDVSQDADDPHEPNPGDNPPPS